MLPKMKICSSPGVCPGNDNAEIETCSAGEGRSKFNVAEMQEKAV